MRGFAFLVALLAVFVFLLFQFSFWVAFGAMYVVGMVLVAFFASFSKHQKASPMVWDTSADIERTS